MSDIAQKATLLRKWSLISTTEAGSGHPTSCLSAADVMAVLFEKYYSYDLQHPLNLGNDRLIFSKGHAAPLFYSLYAAAGAFPFDELKTLRKFSCRLEGHPTPHFPYTEAATGSLGQGLSVGAGLAVGLQKEHSLEKKPHVFVLLGDGEIAEGQVWEAANFASFNKLDNLIAIIDVNGLGQSQATMFGHDATHYADRFTAFGWETMVIDGHNYEEITNAYETAIATVGKPFVIIAKTNKGQGISFLSDKAGWHGKPISQEDLKKALVELGDVQDEVVFSLKVPRMEVSQNPEGVLNQVEDDSYKVGDKVATREIYGKELALLGQGDSRIMALDGEVKNSTFAIDFMNTFPDRYVECFIAEQNMVSVAVGLARLGKIPFVSTFAAFLSRACDQIRMARLSNANVKFVGSHSGISIGEDGTSQMGLEDIAMFATEPDTVVLHPSDAVSCAKLIPEMVKYEGIAYLRTLRSKTAVLYTSDEEFVIGGSKVLKGNPPLPLPGGDTVQDELTVVAMGITVEEALEAYELLKQEHIFIRIVDAYSIKPIDKKTLITCSTETKQKILITVEDHYEHGGLGDAVLSTLAVEDVKVYKMAVTKISHSGTKDELLDDAGISAKHIVEKVKNLISK